jgi:cold-inducible RNA-binding protein
MRLYVGNMPYKATESDLESWFAESGVSVNAVTLMRDRYSGEMRGFGFVEVDSQEQGELAIRSCNGKPFMGRNLTVNEARPMREGAPGGDGDRPRGNGGRGPRHRDSYSSSWQ